MGSSWAVIGVCWIYRRNTEQVPLEGSDEASLNTELRIFVDLGECGGEVR